MQTIMYYRSPIWFQTEFADGAGFVEKDVFSFQVAVEDLPRVHETHSHGNLKEPLHHLCLAEVLPALPEQNNTKVA